MYNQRPNLMFRLPETPEPTVFTHCVDCGRERDIEKNLCDCGAPSWKGLFERHVTHATRIVYTDYGLGVATGLDLEPRTLVESAPALVMDKTGSGWSMDMPMEVGEGQKTNMGRYCYPWRTNYQRALVLGNGLLYNHSFDPNLSCWPRTDLKTGRHFIDFFTIKTVKANEELFVRYADEVWFPPYRDPKA